MMTCKFTHNTDAFNKLNVPDFHYKHRWFSKFYKFPKALIFNTTYYKYDAESKGLVAFRILAYTLNDMGRAEWDKHLIYLVQLPNTAPQWIDNFINPDTQVYASVATYITSSGKNAVDLEWVEMWRCIPMEKVHSDTFFFKETFWTIKNGAVVESYGAWCEDLVVTEQGCFVHISNKSIDNNENGVYINQADASRALLDNLTITDFADPTTIDITIEVLPTAPKVMQIKIIE